MFLLLYAECHVPTAVCRMSCSYCCMQNVMFLLPYVECHVPTAVCRMSCSYCCMQNVMFLLLYAECHVPTAVCRMSCSYCCMQNVRVSKQWVRWLPVFGIFNVCAQLFAHAIPQVRGLFEQRQICWWVYAVGETHMRSTPRLSEVLPVLPLRLFESRGSLFF